MWIRIQLIVFLCACSVASLTAQTDGLWKVEKDGKCGYINRTGVLVIGFKFDDCWSFSEGFATVTANQITRFIDERGNYLTDQRLYSWYPSYFAEGFANVTIKNSQTGELERGFIDTNGRFTKIPDVSELHSFKEGMAVFGRGGRRGYLDISMNVAIKPRFIFAGSFSEGLANVLDENGRNYFIDKSGKEVMSADSWAFSEGLTAFKVKSKYFTNRIGFKDRSSHIVIPARYTHVRYFYEGLCGVVDVDSDKWGFIDKKGIYVVPPQFDEIDDFSEGYAPVAIGGKWGFIDRSGNLVLPLEFDRVTQFEHGVAKVWVGDDGRYIDIKGKSIWKESTKSLR